MTNQCHTLTIEAAHAEALVMNAVLNGFPAHWPEYNIVKFWCQNDASGSR